MAKQPATANSETLSTAEWARRPVIAWMIRILLFVGPIIVGWFAVHLSSPHFYRPDGIVGLVAWIVQAVAIATVATKVATLSVRRLAPLPLLLEMTLIFPDQTPSRFGVALRAGTVKKMLEGDDVALSDDTQAAAEQAVALVGLLRKHESLTRGHTERVRSYADLIGEEMGLSTSDRDRLRWGVLLHDVGKLTVPAEILSKVDPPTDEEWAIIRTHPGAGGEIVAPLADWLGDWVLAASQHHERWDGRGYPNGLAGEEISLAGRITAVADAYDVITSRRSYKDPMSADVARQEIASCAGTQFDPAVVRAFLRCGVQTSSLPGAFSWLLEVPGLTRIAGTASSMPIAGATAVVVAVAGVTGLVAAPETPESLALDMAVSVETTVTSPSTLALERPTDPADDLTVTTVPSTETTLATETTETTDTDVTTSTIAPRTSPTTSATATPTQPPTTRRSAPTTAAPTTPTTAPPTTAASPCQRLRGGESNLAGADLRGCNLAGQTIAEVDLHNADLRNADLTGLRLDHFNLNGANLSGAVLDDAVFADGSMVGANLTGIDARRISITRADVAYVAADQADFEQATIVDVSFGFAQLTNANFRSVSLQGVNFNDGNISAARFDGAQMPGVEFWRTTAIGTNFTSAAMRYSPLGDANVTDARFDAADARDTNVNNTNLDRARLNGASFLSASGVPRNATTATYNATTCPGGAVQSTTCW